MLNQKFLAASALAALCAATALAPPHAHAADQAGLVVVRDSQTGELRAPTADEARALSGHATLQKKAPGQHVETVGAGGSRKVQLGRSALVYSVVARNADGTLSEQCVKGETAAHQAMQSKEPRHETE